MCLRVTHGARLLTTQPLTVNMVDFTPLRLCQFWPAISGRSYRGDRRAMALTPRHSSRETSWSDMSV